ncbi:multiple sugar transport system substrate-binding protein [Actinoplanes octamycinicus]|uniref:Multiple sugar transport system substrate-binding protein n=1 Tax=Actinoplanes octamycinicus TaxID=135948 RepID=A0A7W7M791_9ACTN|nr:extracellular solute-binding protein [Actinoplanes octamycinicus]MBB4739563.1 multiple sugar transport system substrate-binding protein [Actinoplanes octamycinicus]GIE54744.1 ABC transporter substrate-binding protein [Actinoplanes octamycinicus]
MPDLYSRRSFIAGVLTAGMLSTAAGYLFTRRTPVTLTLVTGADSTGARDLLINLWNRFHPDVTIEVVEVNSSTADQYDKFVSTKADIYNLDIIHIPRFSARGRIAPIDRPEGLTLLAPVQRASQVGDGSAQLWAVPFNTDVGMLFRRIRDKTVADPEPALDQVIAATGELAGPLAGQLASEASTTDEAFVINVLEQALAQDSRILDDKGVVSTSLGQWQDALAPLKEAMLGKRIVAVSGEENTNDAFQDRTLRYMRNWPVWYPRIDREERAKPDTAAVRIGRLPIGILGGQSLAVAGDTAHREEAEAVIQFLTGMPAQKLLATYGFAPTGQEAYNDAEVKAAMPHLEKVRSAVEGAHPRPMNEGYADFSRVVRQHTYDYLRRPDAELTETFVEQIQEALK